MARQIKILVHYDSTTDRYSSGLVGANTELPPYKVFKELEQMAAYFTDLIFVGHMSSGAKFELLRVENRTDASTLTKRDIIEMFYITSPEHITFKF